MIPEDKFNKEKKLLSRWYLMKNPFIRRKVKRKRTYNEINDSIFLRILKILI